jgi:hypothetical protein
MDALNNLGSRGLEPDGLQEGRFAGTSATESDDRVAANSRSFPADSAPMPYDLRLPGGRSDQYYADTARFADLFLDEAELRAATLLDGYGRHVQEVLREAPRSRGEYAVELLMLGLALQLYGGAAESAPGWAVELTRELLWLRRRSAAAKPVADFGRAVLSALFLAQGIGRPFSATPASPEQLPRLIEWLSASGEFTQEAMRINNWRGYLATMRGDEAAHWLAESVALYDWFRREAEAALGTYTKDISAFLAAEAPRHRCREDRLLCSRGAVEYHLGMVAAEIMNRGLLPAFERTSHRIVLVPACLRAEPNCCQAQRAGLDLTCTGCRPDCTVNRLTHLMRSLGATVYLVPHSTGFSQWLVRWQGASDVGVTAVACLANIVSGGFEMRARGIASQCVVLDFPGCQRHWSRKGIATEVNEERLVQIVTAHPA